MARWHLFDGMPDLPELAFLPRPGGGMTLEGGGKGGGSSAPPPDPRLVAAQIKSMGIQDDVILRMMANSDSMLPMQKEQTQLAINAAKRAMGESAADREWMLGRRDMLTGLQNQLVTDAATFNLEDKQAELRGQAMADVNQAFSAARGQGNRNAARMGLDPNSGRALAMNKATDAAQASALAKAGQAAGAQARQEGYALTDRANNALAGYPAMGMQATSAGAGFGQLGINAANAGLAGMNSGYGAAGGMAGQMGQNATSMWNAQASYKNSQDQLANQGNDMFGSILGIGLGAMTGGLGNAAGASLAKKWL